MTETDADRVLAAARAELEGTIAVSVRRVAASSPALGLELAAEEADAAIVVVGSTQRGRVGRALASSTGLEILASAVAPVAVATRGFARSPGRPARIGVGFDGSAESADAVAIARRLATAPGATVELIGVLDPPAPRADPARYQAQVRLERLAATFPGNAAWRLVDGPPARCLTAASEDLNLIVVGSRGQGALRRSLLGSVSARLVRDAACPVIAVAD